MAAEPTVEERAAVDLVLGPAATSLADDGHVARGGHELRELRHLLLPALHALQRSAGWISEGGLSYVCQRLDVPPAEAYGVASFYALFSTEPQPPTVLHVCDDIACMVAGAKALIGDLERELGPSRVNSVRRSPCLGLCDVAPAAFLQTTGGGTQPQIGHASMDLIRPFVDGGGWGIGPHDEHAVPQPVGQRRLLRRVGVVDPVSLDDYRAQGGYEALRRAVELGPAGVIAELKDSKLLGRGGAAFPAGVKWEAVGKQPVRPHYFVCNADESEPGTFKDRVLMEGDPFAVLESLTIAGYATGSEKGFIYVRGEYWLATHRLERAIEQAYAHGFLGDDVMGEGFRFDVELRSGAGAYICGEETALFNSIEGKRGEPRNKPPFPVEMGLFGKPTGINNVETLVNVLEVLSMGGPEYAKLGTPDSTGTRLFCLSGCVETPGLYEVEHGTTLGDLIELAGGVRGGRELKAVLLGGAAGTFVGPEDLGLRLTFEDAKAAGATLGSGVVMLFDDTVNLADIVLRIAAFFRDESCGQCVPCRVGTVRQEELLRRLAARRPNRSRDADLALLAEI
ncbi:MAG TPA: NAD(P)H-dependent oxidoreductase subunit E, partial [Actinomycetota bacterium]|nr:NAD(P)H-dependent oxidoreductase subunit E [Actinomycetota bacterium]